MPPLRAGATKEEVQVSEDMGAGTWVQGNSRKGHHLVMTRVGDDEARPVQDLGDEAPRVFRWRFTRDVIMRRNNDTLVGSILI